MKWKLTFFWQEESNNNLNNSLAIHDERCTAMKCIFLTEILDTRSQVFVFSNHWCPTYLMYEWKIKHMLYSWKAGPPGLAYSRSALKFIFSLVFMLHQKRKTVVCFVHFFNAISPVSLRRLAKHKQRTAFLIEGGTRIIEVVKRRNLCVKQIVTIP